MAEDITYEVAIGFNVKVGDTKPRKFAPASVVEVDGHYELRYDAGLVVRLSDLPDVADTDWLINRGSLVERASDEDLEALTEGPEASEEVEDGEAIS